MAGEKDLLIMQLRSNPITSQHSCSVVYPSALFSLEHDEILPYERFARNLLRIAIATLNARGLPERVAVDFATGEHIVPWLLNVSVQYGLTEGTLRLRIPELFPVLATGYCFSLGTPLIEADARAIRSSLIRFVEGGNACIAAYRLHGFAAGVRECYEFFNPTATEFQVSMELYDRITKLIAYHEAGHVYALQLTRANEHSIVENRGFELIADLLAITWFYNKMIRDTPDTPAYRQVLGASSHRDAVFTNWWMALNSLQSLLCLMALAGAQGNNGGLTLDGQSSHPNGLQRFWLQKMHMLNLVESNLTHILSPGQITMLDNQSEPFCIKLLTAGVLQTADLQMLVSPDECDAAEAAADAISRLSLEQLTPFAPMLRAMRAQLASACGPIDPKDYD